MKKILLLTLAALFAMTMAAVADPGDHTNDGNDNFDGDAATFDTMESISLTADIPVIFYLEWETAGDGGNPATVAWTFDEVEIFAGDSATYAPDAPVADDLHFMSNYNDTFLTVERDDWEAPGTLDDPTPDGEFTLKIWNYLAAVPGYVTVPNSETDPDGGGPLLPDSPLSLQTWAQGVNHTDMDVDFQLSGVSVADNPGLYSTEVYFTFGYPIPNS
jgi:hypothetical protein